jgi:ABC-2 type transport system permease protein
MVPPPARSATSASTQDANGTELDPARARLLRVARQRRREASALMQGTGAEEGPVGAMRADRGLRLIAEERRNQTMTFLISAPLSMTQIVIGKFVGLYSFLMLSVALILVMASSMYMGGRLDLGLLGTLSLGLALLIAAFAAVGVFFSSLTAQPVVAATATLATLLGLWLLNMSQASPDSPFLMLALIRRYESFTKGLLDTSDIIFLVVFTAVFLILAIRRLDSDRLGG